MVKEYALYKGDNLIMIGTIKELAEAQKVKEDTIRFYSTPTNKKRDKKGNKKIVIRIGE